MTSRESGVRALRLDTFAWERMTSNTQKRSGGLRSRISEIQRPPRGIRNSKGDRDTLAKVLGERWCHGSITQAKKESICVSHGRRFKLGAMLARMTGGYIRPVKAFPKIPGESTLEKEHSMDSLLCAWATELFLEREEGKQMKMVLSKKRCFCRVS